MGWIDMAEDMGRLRAVVNTAMNFGTAYIVRNLLSEELSACQGGSCCIQLDSCLYCSCKFLSSISLFLQFFMCTVLLEVSHDVHKTV